jgi:hypothetical protein
MINIVISHLLCVLKNALRVSMNDIKLNKIDR